MSTNAIDALLARWREALVADDLADGTIHGYTRDIRRYWAWLSERVAEPTPSDVTPTDLRDYRQARIEAGISPATVNRTLAALARYLDWCRGEGLIQDVPRVRQVPVVEVGIEAPSNLEVSRLTRAAERSGPRDAAIVWMLRGTGARVSELAGARLGDIEVGARCGRWTIRGKGRKIRVVPLNASVRAALTRYLAVRPRTYHDGLLVSRTGDRLGSKGIRQVVDRLSGHTLTPHSLRRYAGTRMVRGEDGRQRGLRSCGRSPRSLKRHYPGSLLRSPAIVRSGARSRLPVGGLTVHC